ncbi:MAG TPA: hypothetical protein P5571_05435 [Candidatus Krumholzibacteria bacterium]|nr:hypothetical protein [Candidatus Krumholzibacteria bacterium]HRX50780.1 hypothetical protein [Candidatus Krumholzibacteria bacterium]
MNERMDLDDRALWNALGRDEAPELERSLWPDVRRRVYGERRQGWWPRLSLAGAGALCAAAGLWLGLSLDGGAVSGTGAMETVVQGSLLDQDAWSLDALYLAADDGSER